MSSDMYRRQVLRLAEDIARLEGNLATEQKRAADLRIRALDERASAGRTTSLSTAKLRLAAGARFEKQAADHDRREADLLRQIATKRKQAAQVQQRLMRAEVDDRRQEQAALTRQLQVAAPVRRPLRDLSDRISSATVVLDDDSIQGTAFLLEGDVLVTCDHVLRPGTVAYLPDAMATRYTIAVIARDPTVDLAIVAIDGLTRLPLRRGSADAIEVSDEVYTAGFANYRPGDSGVLFPGVVVGTRMVSGIRRLQVDARIVGGMSGGPVVDRDGVVIGVCVTGADRLDDSEVIDPYGVVPIDALRFLLNREPAEP
jgi:S1-C subfamily serine protease